MAEKMKSMKNVEKPKSVRITVKRGKSEEQITLKHDDMVIACADYLLYDGVVDGDTDKCIVAYHDHVGIFDYADVTGLLGLDSEYSAEAYGVHIKRDSEKIEVKGDVITYKDKRGNKFTYRMRGLVDFLIID